jgi:zinc and cadmium transporter
MEVWIYTIGSVILVSLISLIGVVGIYFSKEKLQSITFILVSFSVGALFGDALIHLLPKAFRESGTGISTSLYVILGIIIFFILEKFIRWRHCHTPETKEHIHPIAVNNLIGDGVHNFIDGLLIGASYLVSPSVGIATTVAVVLHEIPQELGDSGVLLHTGLSMKKVLLYNFLSASTAIVGAIVSLMIGRSIEGYTMILLPITAGGFIYIAGSDLIPELHHENRLSVSFVQLISILFGVSIMILLLLVD